MSVFKRAIRLFLAVVSLVAAVVLGAAAFIARSILRPPRQPAWRDPHELGMTFSPVDFPARDDGLRLSGWFIPSKTYQGRPQPAVVLVHSWTWQRLGEPGAGFLANLLRTAPVELLRLAFALHQGGYHVLMFDLRNHGESAADGGMTFGYMEANDLLGALDYLKERSEVDAGRLGVVGFSIGANAALYALSRTGDIRAAVAVQPASPRVLLTGIARDILGPLAFLVVPAAEWLTIWGGGMPPSAVNPIFALGGAAPTPLLFIQGAGDRWGTVDDVEAIADQAPAAVDTILLADTDHRYDGYRYLIDHPEIILSFFADYLDLA